MEWVYDAPIKDKRLKKIQSFLEKKTHDKKASERVAKALSLNDFIREHTWKTSSDIKRSVFYDTAKTKPVFDDRQSKTLYRLVKQSGGTSDEAVVLDKGIRHLIAYTRQYMPNIVVNLSDAAYPYVTFLKTLQNNRTIGPVVELLKESAVQTTTTGIVTADAIATDIGGPIGAAIVAIPAAIAGVMVVITHVLEDELGEALLASFLILPFAGPILYKAAISTGKVAKKVSERKQDIINTSRSLLGDSVANKLNASIPTTGGKRLSTQRRRYFKWRMKTLRNEFGKA